MFLMQLKSLKIFKKIQETILYCQHWQIQEFCWSQNYLQIEIIIDNVVLVVYISSISCHVREILKNIERRQHDSDYF